MSIYRITGDMTVSCYTLVKAESAEKAMDAVSERDAEFSTPQSQIDPKTTWVVDELDGEVDFDDSEPVELEEGDEGFDLFDDEDEEEDEDDLEDDD